VPVSDESATGHSHSFMPDFIESSQWLKNSTVSIFDRYSAKLVKVT
jgi:hypothetical protein